MTDFLDKAILLGTSLEGKLKELVDNVGKDKEGNENDSGLPPKEAFENKVVTESTRALKEMLTLLREGKGKVESEFSLGAQSISEKLNIATKSDLDTVKEMARIAREKVDLLEKRLSKIEEEKK